jgi:hypothetical protein
LLLSGKLPIRVGLVSHAYDKDLTSKITAADLNQHDPRIVRRIEAYFREHNIAGGKFDHFKPAAALLRQQSALATNIGDPTLDRAAQLFTRLNDLLL